MSKSYVTLAQHICVVCGNTFDTGELLLDRRLKDIFEHHTVTGWGMCKEHQDLADQNYIALVEIDTEKSDVDSKGIVKPDKAFRLGRIAHVRKGVFDFLNPDQPVVFIDTKFMNKMEDLNKNATDEQA